MMRTKLMTWQMLAALALASNFGALVSASPSDAPPSAFRNISLEKRCEALTAFVKELARTTLAGVEFSETGCAEGNGLGGARYSLDFRLGEPTKARHFRIDISFKGDSAPTVAFCETTDARVSTKQANCSASATGIFSSMHEKSHEFMPKLTTWVTARETDLRIFSQSYDSYLAKIISYQGSYPGKQGDQSFDISFQLQPTAPQNLHTGTIRFGSTAPKAFLECFKCPDTKCLNEELRYRFDGRFLSLMRHPKEPKSNDPSYDAGWILTTEAPTGWKYVCGISRYSLQNLSL